MAQVRLEDMVVGQYRSRTTRGTTLPGYLDDDTVPQNRCGVCWVCCAGCVVLSAGQGTIWCSRLPQGLPTCAHTTSPAPCFCPPLLLLPSPARSITPTFAACAVFVNNARWDGVPFLLKAGKALSSRVAEIRVQFRHVPGNLYRNKLGLDLDKATNELVSVGARGQAGRRGVLHLLV